MCYLVVRSAGSAVQPQSAVSRSGPARNVSETRKIGPETPSHCCPPRDWTGTTGNSSRKYFSVILYMTLCAQQVFQRCETLKSKIIHVSPNGSFSLWSMLAIWNLSIALSNGDIVTLLFTVCSANTDDFMYFISVWTPEEYLLSRQLSGIPINN